MTVDELELRTALHHLADRDPTALAALLVLGQAFIDQVRHTRAEQSKAVAVALCAGTDWSAASRRPSHRELMRRRYPPSGDPELWVRWGPDGPPREVA